MFSCMGKRSKVRRKYNTLWVRFYFSVIPEFFQGLVLICVDGYIFFYFDFFQCETLFKVVWHCLLKIYHKKYYSRILIYR